MPRGQQVLPGAGKKTGGPQRRRRIAREGGQHRNLMTFAGHLLERCPEQVAALVTGDLAEDQEIDRSGPQRGLGTDRDRKVVEEPEDPTAALLDQGPRDVVVLELVGEAIAGPL